MMNNLEYSDYSTELKYQPQGHIIPQPQPQPSTSNSNNSPNIIKPPDPPEPQPQDGTQSGKLKRRGRKPSKVDLKGRLEKSRQSARECRARKKLRYQYVEELVADRERAIFSLRDELESYRKCCHKIDQGIMPNEVKKLVESRQSNMGNQQQSASGYSTQTQMAHN